MTYLAFQYGFGLLNDADEDRLPFPQIEPHSIRIFLIPRDQVRFILGDQTDNKSLQSAYARECASVLMSGEERSDIVLASVLYHELGHALHHRQNRPSFLAAKGTDLNIDEEIEMHWLQVEVLNAASGGKLFAHLDDVIRRQSDRSSYRAVILGLTQADLREYYSTLDLGRLAHNQVSLLSGLYLLALGQRFIHTTQPSTAWAVQERELYRWLIQDFIKRK